MKELNRFLFLGTIVTLFLVYAGDGRAQQETTSEYGDYIDQSQETPSYDETSSSATEQEAPQQAPPELPLETIGDTEQAPQPTPAPAPQPAQPASTPVTQPTPAPEPVVETPKVEIENATAGEQQAPAQETSPSEPEKPAGPDEVQGIDTVDLEDPQGNWLFKRVWWERAEQKFEQIRAAVSKIMEKRTGFFAKRSELDKNVLDPFYIKVGFTQGELHEAVTNLLNYLKTEEEKTRSDSDLFEKIQQNKKQLEDLKKEVETINKQDEAVDKALMQLVDQINKLRNYEQQAWQDFKAIARVLDDKKARELFYKVDNAWRNIQKIQEYIEQTFTSSFDRLTTDVQQQVNRIQDSVAELKERNLLLKEEITPTEGQEAGQSQSLTARVLNAGMDIVRGIYNTLMALIRWPFELFMPASQEKEAAVPEEEAVSEEQAADVKIEDIPVPVSEPSQESEQNMQPEETSPAPETQVVPSIKIEEEVKVSEPLPIREEQLPTQPAQPEEESYQEIEESSATPNAELEIQENNISQESPAGEIEEESFELQAEEPREQEEPMIDQPVESLEQERDYL